MNYASDEGALARFRPGIEAELIGLRLGVLRRSVPAAPEILVQLIARLLSDPRMNRASVLALSDALYAMAALELGDADATPPYALAQLSMQLRQFSRIRFEPSGVSHGH